jgi:glycosyltransferase involved in cell wall biosynthesis
MRILHVSTLYECDNVGGLELAVKKVAEAQARLGHEVMVLARDCKSHSHSLLKEVNRVEIYRIKSFSVYSPYLTFPLESFDDEVFKSVDIVHGWGGQNYYFVYKALKKAKDFDKRTVNYFIGVDYLRYHYNPFMRFFGYLYQKNLTKRVSKLVDLALVTNEYEKYILEKIYKKKAIVLSHGVDEIYINTPNLAQLFRERYKIPESSKIIAYIGRIHKTKGLDILIRSFQKIAEEIKDVELIIAGKGDPTYLNRCLKIAKKLNINKKIRYLGFISEEDKIGLIDAADVVVLPTRHAGESYPLIMDEVRARRKKLLVFSVNPSIASYNFVIPVEGMEDLITKILEALEFKNNKLKDHSKPLLWDEIALKLVNLYENI